ncbi:restriction endonuclease [Undibacterium amnicola]|uniref:Restriction endonuclease n=1 Tax=Undibacterium amnicola TaxID=1834038 RepID=A0ABR6XS02_9BURK|nr:PmeII family type II restriction endonuclease [Undibacterium amnicola]MBC3832271.1 restriction endonuclease [Undibacterium amnicola]
MIENKNTILAKAKTWFRETIVINHAGNSQKLVDPKEFNINPFLTVYLANFLTGNSSPQSIAKALIYPRVLGNSITTSFGANIQKFASDVLDGFASTTSGIDIEFIDQVDGVRKYCQLKAGPNTINKDDVESIAGHFKGVINLAKVNGLRVSYDDMVVGLIYGEAHQLSAHYKRITSQYNYPVLAAHDFWFRLTGDDGFYGELVTAIGEVAIEADYSQELNKIIDELAQHDEIIRLSQIK